MYITDIFEDEFLPNILLEKFKESESFGITIHFENNIPYLYQITECSGCFDMYPDFSKKIDLLEYKSEIKNIIKKDCFITITNIKPLLPFSITIDEVGWDGLEPIEELEEDVCEFK